MTPYEPTELEEMFRDIEEVPYMSNEQEAKRAVAIKKAIGVIHRRARAIITYALGACQLPNIRAMLEPLELFSMDKANEIIQPDKLLAEVSEDEALHPNVLPHLQSLEEAMHQKRERDPRIRKKSITELAQDLAQLKNVA